MSQPIAEKEAGPPRTPDEGPDDGEKKKREYKDFGHDEEPKATRAYLIANFPPESTLIWSLS